MSCGIRTCYDQLGEGDPCVPDSELAIIPGTSHGLLVEKPLCNSIIIDSDTSYLSRAEAISGAAPAQMLARMRWNARRAT